jgi:hypothetical protein
MRVVLYVDIADNSFHQEVKMKSRQFLAHMFLLPLVFLTYQCTTTENVIKLESASPANQVAEAYGISGFNQIEAIRYTFNVQINAKRIQREWMFEPKTDRVSFKGLDPKGKPIAHTYLRGEMFEGNQSLNRKVDKWYINDHYWLFFPFHLKWDTDIELSYSVMEPLPIPPGQTNRIIVQYPATGGYTPGDIYELYYGPDYMIKQWIYRKGGSPQPSRITTWEKHAKVGPIILALDHRSPDGKFRLWFSDVAVKLVNSDRWLTPVDVNLN